MMAFWIGTILLLAVSCILIVYPLYNPKEVDEAAQRDDLNKAFYKDRLAELDSEVEEGVVANKDELVTDLNQLLLDDIPNATSENKADNKNVKWVAIPAVLFMIVMSYGMYAMFGAQDKVAHWVDVNNNLPQLSQKLMAPEGVELTDQEMEDLTLGLRTRLYSNPEDTTGWVLLGRIGLANRDIQTAIGALSKADELKPDDPEIMISLVQALLFSSNQNDINKATTMMHLLLQQPEVDLRVYSLLAFQAYNDGNYADAIKYWKQLQGSIAQDDPRREMLQRSINTAQRELDAINHPQVRQAPQAQGTPVKVTISLASDVELPESGVLIVSVHSADGSPMPVAAARFPVDQFPKTVVLDDRNSMLENRKLSTLSDIIVRVRIDSDGDVSTKDHDWHGESLPIHLGDDVVVSINKKY